MTVPIEAKTFTFTPELLKGKEGAPTFILRYGTRRDKHAYRAELAARGLVSYTDAQIRAAMLDEIRRLSQNTDEAKDRMVDTAKRFWDSQDAHQKMIEEWLKDVAELRDQAAKAGDDPATLDLPAPPENDFDAEERAWIVGIMEDVKGRSRVLGGMNKANVKRNFITTEVALAVLLISAEGFELSRDTDGVIEVDCLAAMQDWLGDLAEKMGVDAQYSDDAYTDLCNAAFLAFHMPKEAEKNFASALQPSSPEDSLRQEEAAPVDTPSTDSVKSNSKKTRSEADTTPTGNSANSPSAAEIPTAESNGQMGELSLTSPAG